MRSLRELRTELLGVRLSATGISQWYVEAAVNEYARVALNDAISNFAPTVEAVYTSGVPTNAVIVLPRHVERVTAVEVPSTTGATLVKHWEYRPTAHTQMVYIGDTISTGTRLDVTYVYQQPQLPADVYLVSDSYSSVQVSGASPANTWPAAPAYVEFYLETGNYAHREVAMYTAVTPTGFSGLVRNLEGENRFWWGGSTISPCWVAPDRDRRPIMLMAQAVMYEYWMRHRALYDQYTAMASMQAMSLEDLQLLVRDLESRAMLAWSQRGQRQIPAPGRAKLRGGIPR